MAEEETQQQEQQQINLDEITVEQALNILTGAVRAQPFTYGEHVNLEQCRRAVEEAVTA
jgi:hypothetical protein|tara:strand:- start:31 stop:207 length:177 start_codon:yes stop_codon:yes gene_type:complete